MTLQLPKGTRDFPPEEKIARDGLIARIVRVFARFGFSPLETPTFERWEVLSAKYAGGAEILKETFRLKDQGNRNLGLRYDLTVPLARFVGMNPQLKMPFKRYAIGRVFRDGPIKLGRYREFYQCDADIVGSGSMLADAELLLMAAAGFRELEIPVTIFLNNRKLLEALLKRNGVPDEKLIDAMLTLDKVKKISLEDLKKELREKNIPESSVDFVLSLSTKEASNDEKLSEVRDFLGSENEGFQELQELLTYLKGVQNIIFDPSLARGLAYYTSTVFEGFADDSKVSSSLCGGGRYDRMIGQFLDGREVPAVGFSFGLEPIMDLLKERGEVFKKTLLKVFVIPIKNPEECISIVEKLRHSGINSAMDLNGRSISKNLDYANSYDIPFVLICGPKELSEGKVKLKNMASGEEELLDLENAIEKLS